MKILLNLIIFSLLFLHLEASDKQVFYYASNHRPVESIQEAKYMKRVEVKRNEKQIIHSFMREENDWKLVETKIVKNITEGHQLVRIKKSFFSSTKINRYYSENSNGFYGFRELIDEAEIRTGSASTLVPLHLEGEVKEFFSSGRLKTIALYRNNQLQSNENWLRDGIKYFDNLFYSVDEEPEYSLGFENFRNHILTGLMNSGYDITNVNEKIVMGWVILEDGKMAGIHQVSGKLVVLSKILAELLETLPGTWSPARLNGEVVRFYMNIPFNFIYRGEGFQNLELNNGLLLWD